MKTRRELVEVVGQVRETAIEIMTDLVEEIGWLDQPDASELAEAALENLSERLADLADVHPPVRDRSQGRRRRTGS
jgi:hypothetical protein